MWSTFFSAQATPVQNRADQQHTNKAAERKRPLNPAKNSKNQNNQEDTHRKTPKTQYTQPCRPPTAPPPPTGEHIHTSQEKQPEKNKKRNRNQQKTATVATPNSCRSALTALEDQRKGAKRTKPQLIVYITHITVGNQPISV